MNEFNLLQKLDSDKIELGFGLTVLKWLDQTASHYESFEFKAKGCLKLFGLAMLEYILVTFAQSFMYSGRWVFCYEHICAVANTFFCILTEQCHVPPVQTADAHIEVSDQTPSGCRGCWECVAGAGSLWLPPSPWSLSQPSPGSICHPQISQVWHRISQTHFLRSPT